MSTQKRGFGQKGETGVYPNDLFGGKKGRRERFNSRKERAKRVKKQKYG